MRERFFMDKVSFGGAEFCGYTIPTTNASLLAMRAKSGMLACGYLKIETADKLGDALAVVSGVSSYSDMLAARVVAVSAAAAKMGVSEGMSGGEALLKMNS